MAAPVPGPDDERWMQAALQLARDAQAQGEVPVGAVLVMDGEAVGRGSNRPVSTHDPSAHAEIVALRDAALASNNYRLPGSTLYVTIEPCTMCMGALMHARVARLVFGAREPRAGAALSNLRVAEQSFYNHRIEVTEGVMADACSALMTEFFAARRRGGSGGG